MSLFFALENLSLERAHKSIEPGISSWILKVPGLLYRELAL
jgi:hypothetical protein